MPLPLRSGRPVRRRGPFAFLLTLLLASAAGATTMFRADVPTLARTSDTIVRGRVLGLQSHWSGDRMRIVTDVRIQVEEVLKGAPGQTITVRQPGGTVGDIGQRVSGLAVFHAGEEVLVFLERTGPVSRVAGMAQGKFHLDRSASGELRATPDDVGDAEVIDRQTRTPRTPSRAPVAYPTLKAEIARALQATPSAR